MALPCAIAVAAWALVGGAVQAEAFPFPPQNGKLVLVSDRDSVDANGDSEIQASERNRDVYSINPDGSGLQRLTSGLATDTSPTVSPDGRWIAFTSDRDGGEDLYLMRFNGSNETRVTDRGAPDREPSFSADGRRLAYSVSHKSTLPSGASEGDIWTVNVDGSETTRLTFDRESDEFDPAFSPDGSKVAFVSGTPGGPNASREILVMDADGSNVTNLTAANGGAGFEDDDPAFSPDGTKIAFTSKRGGGTEIWVMDADGSDPEQLTDQGGADQHPAFSPDGTKIAFDARRGGRTDVYTMNASDGSGQARLTDNTSLDEKDELAKWQAVPPAGQLEAFIDSGPASVGSDPDVTFTYSGVPAPQLSGFQCRLDGSGYSQCPAGGISYSNLSDGEHLFRVRAIGTGDPDPEAAEYSFEIDTTRIVYASGEGADSEIYAVNPDGSGLLRLTNNAVRDAEPALSPDGTRVAFASNRDGDDEIYVIDANGSGGAAKLTNNSASEGSPAYSPDGSEIAFTTRRDGNLEVYVMGVTGATPTNLTNHPAADSEPSFSGDGTKIAFESDRAAGNVDVYSMNANGSAVTRLTTYENTDESPDFAPDGKQIAFTRNVFDPAGPLPSNDDVWVMNANGGGATNITNHPRGIDDREPSYRPDGAKIVYVDQGDIYLQNPDGSARTKVTSRLHLDAAPDWGPAYTDLDPPNTIIDSDPGSLTNDPTATFTFSSTESGSSFECRVDSGGFAACGSPYTTAPLSDGEHSFRVRATDRAGNTDPTPAEHQFTVDRTAPDKPTFTATVPGSPANENAPLVRGASDWPVAIYTSPDCTGAPVASGSSAQFSNPGIAVAVADNTTTTFYAEATDSLGKSSGCSIDSIAYVEDSKVRGSATAKQKQRQSGKKIVIKAKVNAREDSDAKGKGKVKIGNRSYKLEPKTKPVGSGQSKNLKLKPKKPKDARRIARALAKGKKTVARITVRLIDEADNVKAQSFRVKLKR